MSDAEGRKGPEEYIAPPRQEGRGRLRIYLGFAPGVGKTYQMLEEAGEAQRRGLDVVAGIIETHGRAETAALLVGLEALLPRVVKYRGLLLRELDVEAALRRRPKLLLVDELAHTNSPGSRNAKRWQDVQELLDAGIDVATTVNVQHVESLKDVVAQATGVQVQETVPDFVVANADEIVSVDLPANDLLARLREGKVYTKERAEAALQHFFLPENLEALRELALLEVTKGVMAKAARREGSIEPGRELRQRVMVCMRGSRPETARLLRRGARLAGRLHADWIAVYVETRRFNVRTRTVAETQSLADNIELAHSLGAEVVRLEGDDVARVLLDFARTHRIGQVVLGQTRRSGVSRFFRGDVIREMLKGAGSMDVHVVNLESEEGGGA